MKLRPHHLLDIISDYGHDAEFKPDPYGHALHKVARTVLSDIDLKTQFIIGADEVCRPCKHLQPNGRCDDILSKVTPPISKQEYNDNLDGRLFAYLGLSPGMTMTIRRFLESVNEKVPSIEGVCSHPGEDPKARLVGLIQGLTKLGIRRKKGPTMAKNLKIDFSQSAETIETFDFVEVTLKVENANVANPFTDVVVEGQFTGDSRQPVRVDGFCDSEDGSTFRVRFMPTRPGNYDYSLKYRQGPHEVSKTGSFSALDGRRRGIVRVDREHPWHFVWEGTGEHYFWNGTTAYWLVGWDDETIPRNIDRLASLKVNRIRSAIMGRVNNGRAWYENVFPTDKFTFLLNPWKAERPDSVENPGFDVTRFNVAHWQKYERLLRKAREKDVVISVVFYVDGSRRGTDPFGREGAGGEDEQRYYRYAVARFAAFSNVMWDVANEYRSFRDDAWAGKMGTLIRKWDPYDHLMSVHGHRDFRFRTSPWADFAMYQCWDEHGGHDYMLRNRTEQAKTGRIIPQVNEEYGYEDHYPVGWGESRKAPARSADNRRRLAWSIYMAGCYQTTGERADTGTGWGPDTGGGWINGRGDNTMTMLKGYGHIVDFFTSINWWELNPDNASIEITEGGPQKRVYASRTEKGDLAVVYFSADAEVMVKPGVLEEGLEAEWFNPRNGHRTPTRSQRTNIYRTPDDQDWVLLFHRSNPGL